MLTRARPSSVKFETVDGNSDGSRQLFVYLVDNCSNCANPHFTLKVAFSDSSYFTLNSRALIFHSLVIHSTQQSSCWNHWKLYAWSILLWEWTCAGSGPSLFFSLYWNIVFSISTVQAISVKFLLSWLKQSCYPHLHSLELAWIVTKGIPQECKQYFKEWAKANWINGIPCVMHIIDIVFYY